MLGPLMLCYKKDEVHVMMLCDILIEKCPGLKNSFKAIESDCERVFFFLIVTFTRLNVKNSHSPGNLN